MAVKPNFTGVHRTGDTLVVSGISDPEPAGDIVEVRVILAQGERLDSAVVAGVGRAWNVEIPSDGFVAGPARAFGVETRREESTTFTWAEQVDIPA